MRSSTLPALLHSPASAFCLIGLIAPALAAGSVDGRALDASVQWSEEALTAAEWDEAQRFVERFSERLAEKGDLEPLIDEFFVTDLGGHLRYLVPEATIDHIVNNEDFYTYAVTPELVAEAGDDELEAYFARTVSFWYLIARRLYGSYPMQEIPRDLKLQDLVGGEATDIFRGDPTWRRIIGSPGWSRSGSPFSARSGVALVENLESFRGATITLGEAVARMRTRLPAAHEAELYAMYVEQMSVMVGVDVGERQHGE